MLSHYHHESPRQTPLLPALVRLGRQPLLVVCAFEGILAPRASGAEPAPLHPKARNALAALIGHPKHQAAVLSSLQHQHIDHALDLFALNIIGMHGLQQTGDCAPIPDPKSLDHLFDQLAQIHGCRLERTDWTLEVELDASCTEHLHKTRTLLSHVQVPGGWEVLEAGECRRYQPIGFGKAQALERLMSEHLHHHVVYIAEEASNHEAFVLLELLGGTAIKVGKGESGATFQMDGPDGVLDLLETWVQFSR